MSGMDAAMFDLFREEVKVHAETLSAGLIVLEANASDPTRIEPLMRAAHSIKGAARIAGIESGVRLAHVMEDSLVAAQEGRIHITPADVDVLLKGADLLAELGQLTPDTAAAWDVANATPVSVLESQFVAMAAGLKQPPLEAAGHAVVEPRAASTKSQVATPVVAARETPDNFPEPPPFEPPTIPDEPFVLGASHSVYDLFREELRGNLATIAKSIPALTSGPTAVELLLESLKQIRGAARLVKCDPVAVAAGTLVSFFHTAHNGTPAALDWLRFAVATLAGALTTSDENFLAWAESTAPVLASITEALTQPAPVGKQAPPRAEQSPPADVPPAPTPSPTVEATNEPSGARPERPSASPPPQDAVVRVAAQSLNRLMGLAGESLVQARWLPSFSTALLKLKRHHDRLASVLDAAYHAAAGGEPPAEVAGLVADARQQWAACRQELGDQSSDFEEHAARAEDLNARLYREVIASRMRPFVDGTHGLARLVRDMARSLGKEARLVVAGEGTEVDRDILEKLESPLSHLVRNSIDHGLESPAIRERASKPAAGTITVEARHRAGMLHVTVSDDGAGIELERLRKKIVERGLNSAEVVARLTEAELLEFLFLPGFSTASVVTEYSGRGVGLDVVQDTVRRVGGNVRATTISGAGTTFHMQLPLTLSVIRAVIVEVAGEPYAFPHTRIDRLLRVPREEVRSIEHRQFVTVDGANVGLVMAGQVLDIPSPPPASAELPVVLLSDGTGEYGLVVDDFRGEQDLVVRPLDPRLGKVPNLSTAAILDDGSPVLIVDVEDLFRSMDQFIQTGLLVRCETRSVGGRKKRVLVVDDSITVREVERQLLLHHGYEVAVAVDGVDGWNKVRAEQYDLMVSDIDMPRMNGLQLVQTLRADEHLKDMPVIIVSYKEREEDRVRGLEVGANAYLTKSSFHDNRFMEAVADLIGPAE